VEPLLAWFRRHRADLPWRRTRDPYKIWVSEVMLQQTQVAAVVPYYERFVRRFPTVRALARAPLGAVLKCWEGLGYYARARNLRAAARLVVARHGGRLPRTLAALRALPGVGEYTAAAVGSIAFGIAEPVVDGNVRRVTARYWATDDPPRPTVPPRAPGDFNQAIMELGRLVCRPRRPDCPRCPLRRDCRARRRGDPERFPARRRRGPVPHHHVGVGVVWKDGRVLISRRPEEGLLGGLWEFPGGKRRRGESVRACVRRELAEELGIRVAPEAPVATVPHRYSHFAVTLHAWSCRWIAGRPRPRGCTAFRWVRPRELRRYPFPAASLRIIEALDSPPSPGARSRLG
jgi:A/G-specific adenine glycosylase